MDLLFARAAIAQHHRLNNIMCFLVSLQAKTHNHDVAGVVSSAFSLWLLDAIFLHPALESFLMSSEVTSQYPTHVTSF